MKKTFRFLVYLLSVAALITAFQACERDDDDSLPGSSGNPGTVKTQVLIFTGDSNGDPVAGVTVRIGNSTVITDNLGNAIFRDIQVDKKRFIVKASKNGHFEAIKGVSIQQGSTSYHVQFSMLPLPAPSVFSASTGGNINLSNGGTVVFAPGSIATSSGTPYTGPVQVYSHYYSPSDPDFETAVPGGDLLGVDDYGNNVALVSFGMMNVQLHDPSGNPLNLLPGTTAQLTFPIAASQSAVAPATIPMWYLDESTSIWMEEGVATKQGNAYVGTVSHFTYWNCDYPGERANITGTVVDCNGNPVSGAVVTLNGFMNLTTNSAGIYSTWVPSGWSITYQILTQYNPWLSSNSTAQTLTASANQSNTVPVFTTPCFPTLTGSTFNCSGSPIGTFIVIQQGSNTYQTYQPNSQFTVTLPYTGTFNASFYNGAQSFDTTITVAQGSIATIPLGAISLCNTAVVDSLNYISFNGPLAGNHTYYISNTYTEAYGDTVNLSTYFYHTGLILQPTNYAATEFTLPLASTGVYYQTINSTNNYFSLMSDNFELHLWDSTNYINYTITNYSFVSGQATVSFSGEAFYVDLVNNNSSTVNITQANLVFNLYHW